MMQPDIEWRKVMGKRQFCDVLDRFRWKSFLGTQKKAIAYHLVTPEVAMVKVTPLPQ
jgi:hypothetical protein